MHHTSLTAPAHLLFVSFVFLCSFADMESALKQLLRAKYGAAANGRSGFELLQSGFKDPQFTAVYTEIKTRGMSVTTLLKR